MSAQFAANSLKRIAQLGIGLGFLAVAEQTCLYNVDGGEAAVVMNRFYGLEKMVKGEGTHFRVPYLQEPHVFSIRSSPRTFACDTGTRDLQTIHVALRILQRPVVDKLPEIFDQYGKQYEQRILPSIVNEVLKAVVAQYNADQLITMRDKVSSQIRTSLLNRATRFNINIDDVSITDLQFGTDFTAAVESKQVALQEAERSKFVVMKAEQLKRVAIIEAEGEAEAAELISKALAKSGRGIIEVRRIDAAKEIAQKLGMSPGVTYLPGGNNMLLNVNP